MLETALDLILVSQEGELVNVRESLLHLLDSLELGLPEFGVYYKFSIIINGRWRQDLWGLLELLVASILFLLRF